MQSVNMRNEIELYSDHLKTEFLYIPFNCKECPILQNFMCNELKPELIKKMCLKNNQKNVSICLSQ